MLQASPFRTPILSFIKMMSMTAGGPDDSIFRFSNDDSEENDEVPFPGAAYFIWVIFIVVMPLLFVNFLVREYTRKLLLTSPCLSEIFNFTVAKQISKCQKPMYCLSCLHQFDATLFLKPNISHVTG